MAQSQAEILAAIKGEQFIPQPKLNNVNNYDLNVPNRIASSESSSSQKQDKPSSQHHSNKKNKHPAEEAKQ